MADKHAGHPRVVIEGFLKWQYHQNLIDSFLYPVHPPGPPGPDLRCNIIEHAWLLTWTWRRLSPWRSFTQPAYQLEGLPLGRIRRRVKQLRRRKAGSALLITAAFSAAEACLVFTALSSLVWFAPAEAAPDLATLFFEPTNVLLEGAAAVAYAIVIGFLEPFYVAAGFGMYLNRRAELEAWDVEQELRRAFGR
jgi:hypothetical protein